jgi:hypothetical protein
MKHGAVLLAWAGLGVLFTRPAAADDLTTGTSPSEDAKPMIDVGVEGDFLSGLGSACRADVDVVDCSNGPVMLGAGIAARIRPMPWWSFGVLGSYATETGSVGTASSDGSRTEQGNALWRLSLEARFIPLRVSHLELSLGGEVGLANNRQTTTYYPSGLVDSDSTGAILFGLGGGAEWAPLPELSLGPSIRLLHATFERSITSPGPPLSVYSSPWWLNVGLNATAHIWL